MSGDGPWRLAVEQVLDDEVTMWMRRWSHGDDDEHGFNVVAPVAHTWTWPGCVHLGRCAAMCHVDGCRNTWQWPTSRWSMAKLMMTEQLAGGGHGGSSTRRCWCTDEAMLVRPSGACGRRWRQAAGTCNEWRWWVRRRGHLGGGCVMTGCSPSRDMLCAVGGGGQLGVVGGGICTPGRGAAAWLTWGLWQAGCTSLRGTAP